MTFGETITTARISKNLTQRTLSFRIVGKGTGADISSYECGKYYPRFTKLRKLCEELDLDFQEVAELIAREKRERRKLDNTSTTTTPFDLDAFSKALKPDIDLEKLTANDKILLEYFQKLSPQDQKLLLDIAERLAR